MAEAVTAVPERLTLTVEETAALLGISKWKVYECIRTGDIPSVSFGRRVVVPRGRLERLIDGEEV